MRVISFADFLRSRPPAYGKKHVGNISFFFCKSRRYSISLSKCPEGGFPIVIGGKAKRPIAKSAGLDYSIGP